jgi:AraC-like DNA-binding protein
VVPLANTWGLFKSAAEQVDQDIGWRVAFLQGNCLSGALVNKLDDAQSLYVALKRLIQLIKTESSHIELGLLKRQYHVLFYTHHPDMRGAPGYNIAQSYQIGTWCELIRHFAGAEWNPRVIGLEAQEAPKVLKEKFPDSRIRVNQTRGYISVPRFCLHRKLNRRHATIHGQPGPDLAELSFAETLALIIEPHLHAGYPGLSLAASILGCSTRTVGRRLAACGTSYQALVDELRFKMAKRLLEDLDRPIAQVSSRVGFSDQTNFTRMFQRIGGLTPRQFRSDIVNSPASDCVRS